jgi:hypothetical protein
MVERAISDGTENTYPVNVCYGKPITRGK